MLIAALKAWKDLIIYTLSYKIIISLFKISFCHSKYILGDVQDNYVQKLEKKNFFFVENVFLP